MNFCEEIYIYIWEYSENHWINFLQYQIQNHGQFDVDYFFTQKKTPIEMRS